MSLQKLARRDYLLLCDYPSFWPSLGRSFPAAKEPIEHPLRLSGVRSALNGTRAELESVEEFEGAAAEQLIRLWSNHSIV